MRLTSVIFIVLAMTGQLAPAQPTPAQQAARDQDAAVAFARLLAPDERSPEFSFNLRRALALAQGIEVPAIGVSRNLPMRRTIDADPRFLARQAAYLQGQQRTIGGVPARSDQYPETVAVMGNDHLCTGSLIGPDAVLTAAHCFCHGAVEQVVFGETVNAPRATVAVKSATAMVRCHEDLGGGDLAILRLEHAVNVAPAVVALAATVDTATDVIVVGFGTTQNPLVDPAGIKRYVGVPVATSACNGQVQTVHGLLSDADYYGCVSPDELVAGAWALNKDSCNGDSGGPVFVTVGGRQFLAGATSRATGAPGVRPCGDGGIYVRLGTKALSWMKTLGVTPAVQP